MKETVEDRLRRVENLILLGKEDAFILAWGRSMAWLAEKRLVLYVLTLLCLSFGLGMGYFAWQNQNRKSLVIAVDVNSGRAIPVDPDQFFSDRGSDNRSANELKGFALEWVREAYEFSFLNTKEKWIRALSFVDKGAQSSAMFAMRVKERAEMVDRGMDVKILEGSAAGQPWEALVDAMDPIRVTVGFRRVGISTSGQTKDLPPLTVRLEMRLVPRSPQNPHGLVISEVASAAS